MIINPNIEPSEISGVLNEMLDSFRNAGVLLDSTVGDTREPPLPPTSEQIWGEA